MNGDLPEEISEAALDGEFQIVKAWLAGGSASAPRSVNSSDGADWTLLHWTVVGDLTPEHVEFARYLISQGARVNATAERFDGSTALHFACGFIRGEATAAMVSMLVAAGATVNTRDDAGLTPLFCIDRISESTIDVVTTLLRAGASLDNEDRQGSIRSLEEHLNSIDHVDPYGENRRHVRAVRALVASVRAAGSWKAHCRLPHKQVLRFRSLVARGRVKLPSRTRRRSPRGRDVRQKRALEFVLRQGDNGIVWNILSFWREAA